MTTSTDNQNAFQKLIGELDQAGVRFLRTEEQLVMAQTKMLASFARAGIPSVRWKHLERCGIGECRHRKCSAACHFGEYRQQLELILPAQELLEASGKLLWFVTVSVPRYFCGPNELGSLSINAMQQWLRRRIKEIEHEFGPVFAFGGIEVSYEIDSDGVGYWGPHFHFFLACDAVPGKIGQLLRPDEPLPPNFKPVVLKPATNLANGLSYCVKRTPAARTAYCGSRGTQDRYKYGVDGPEKLKHDLWLLDQKPTERLFMRGFKRVHGKLTLIGGRS